jgi:Calcineurin-like phosphoesterase
VCVVCSPPSRAHYSNRRRRIAEPAEHSDSDSEPDEEGPDGAPHAATATTAATKPRPLPSSLGPVLLEAVMERFKHRHPRVIVIGDVHGCLEELQELIRQADYRPGDLLLFLGDLVAKGPDSVGVVRMARELGGITVRGNHEFEVCKAVQSYSVAVTTMSPVQIPP